MARPGAIRFPEHFEETLTDLLKVKPPAKGTHGKTRKGGKKKAAKKR